MSRTIKEFIKLYLLVTITICALAFWFFHWKNETYLDRIRVQQATLVTNLALLMEQDISSRGADAQFLAGLTSRFLHEPHHDWLKELENDFSDFARSRPYYSQIRFIDAVGMERVRIDRSFAGPVVTPGNSLQDNSHRYYFHDALVAPKDTVYISRFDLNIEQGQIEKPYNPTLRLCCPVVAPDGSVDGIIAINYNGHALLNRLKQQGSLDGSACLLADAQGNWMLGPTPDEEWGHITKLNSSTTAAQRFPEAWAVGERSEKAQVLTSNGLFSFATIGIIPDRAMSDRVPSLEESSRRWKLFTWCPPSELAPWWGQAHTLLALVGFVLLTFGCWHVADYRVRARTAEARVQESEERNHVISQATQDAIVMIDDQARVIHWNPAAERLLGYTAEEVLDQNLHDKIVPEAVLESARRGFEQYARTGAGKVLGRTLEVLAKRKDNSQVAVEIAISSFEYKDKWYAVGSLRDITKRKQDERELKQSEEVARALINAPTESILLADPGGTILDINETGARRLGYTINEVIGKNVYDHINPVGTAQKDFLRKVMVTGAPIQFDCSHSDLWLLVNAYPVKDPDGLVSRVAIFARDITQQRLVEAALKDSEQRFRDITDAISEFVWETDPQGILRYVGGDTRGVFGYGQDEMIGRDLGMLFPQVSAREFEDWLTRIYQSRKPFSNVEMNIKTKSGQNIWLLVAGKPFFDSNGQFAGFRGAGRDITRIKNDERAIKANERRLRALAESAYDAIVMIDAKGKISFWNYAAQQLFGYSEEEALGSKLHKLIATDQDRQVAEQNLKKFAVTGTGSAIGAVQEVMALRKDGTTFPVERSVAGFRLEGEWCAVATIRDITERKETEAKLRELATTDSLTGLNNRRRFMELSQQEFSRSMRYHNPVSLFMIDIDHFKKVNDTYGHDVGDVVLQSLAEIALNALRATDIVGRLGGEEFAVLLPETNQDAALEVAQRLRQSVERTTMNTPSGDISITISIGVATLDDKIKNLQHLLKKADTALYEAKDAGRNRVVVS